MTTKTSSQLVYDLFNRSNPTLPFPLAPANVTLGVPAVNSSGISLKNTMVTMTAVAGQGYSGSTTAYYNRVSLADIVATGSSNFFYTNQVTSSDVLPLFNTAFNTNLQASDIVVENLPAPDGTGKITYTLTANPHSLAFNASVQITLTPATVDLAAAVTNTDMNGLTLADVTGP